MKKIKNQTLNLSHGDINDRPEFILNASSPFAVSEAYRSARTNLRFVSSPDGCTIIATTSSVPKEGKTITCINLAVSLAENNHKVLLIDADMRMPQVATALGVNKFPGLSELLAGIVKFTDDDNLCRQSSGIKNLDIISAGKTPPNPAELLASKKMKELLDKLAPEYDYIMIDTPPPSTII